MDKKNTAPTSNANPSDATARLRFEAVVVTEGTVGGKPARVALYGTRYAACEVLDEGGWAVAFEAEYGGLRGSSAMKKHLDIVETATTSPLAAAVASVAPSVVAVLAADAAAEVVPAAVEPEPVVETAPAAVEPVLTTLDEVRAAFDAETRGACRASVLRALRVRAGEIALGLPAGGKAEKLKAERPLAQTSSGEHSLGFRVKAAISHPDAIRNADGSIFVSQAVLVACKFSPSAVTLAGRWDCRSGAHIAAVAIGYTPKFSVKAGGVTFTPISK